MPNWCTTTIIIEDDGEGEEDLRQFANLIGGDFDFDRIIPMPEELRSTLTGHHEYHAYYETGSDQDDNDRERRRAELDQDPKNREKADQDKALLEKYGAYDWDDWSMMNWGTKWPAEGVSIEADEDRITIIFDTAWSFPEPIFQKLSEMFPSLYFRGHADEPNMGWMLVFQAHNGQLRVARLDPWVDQEENEVLTS
jgi:Ferredoxin-like domain in Api92-like protein